MLILPLSGMLFLCISCNSDYKYVEGSSSTYTFGVQFDNPIYLKLPVNEGDRLQIAITGETIQINASLIDPTGKILGSDTFANGQPIVFPTSKKGIYVLAIQGPPSFSIQQVGALDNLTVSTESFASTPLVRTESVLKWLLIPIILGIILLIIFFKKNSSAGVPAGYLYEPPSRPDWVSSEHGPAYRPEDKIYNEHVEFVDSGEIIRPQSVSDEGKGPFSKYKFHNSNSDAVSRMRDKIKSDDNDMRKSMLKQEVSNLTGEGKITPNEAIKLNKQIDDSVNSPKSYIDTDRFLRSIRNRPNK
jgi:hypothetical protein